MFDSIELSGQEKNIQLLNHRILDFVQRVKSSPGMKTESYVLPEDYEDDETGRVSLGKKNHALFKRYEETQDQAKFMNDEDLWLDNRLKQAGPKSTKRVKQATEGSGYVFENQIDFIKKDVLEELEKQEKIQKYLQENPKTELEELKEQLQQDASEEETAAPKEVDLIEGQIDTRARTQGLAHFQIQRGNLEACSEQPGDHFGGRNRQRQDHANPAVSARG